jgi:hypothetical protein
MPLKSTNSLQLEDFDSPEDLCAAIRGWRQEDLDADARNRDRGIDDTRYAAGYQWPAADYAWRTQNDIPAMTFNMVPSLLRDRLGARARRRIGPRILPISTGKQYDSIAFIREGLTRNIERNSDIPTVDGIVSQNQLIAGVGNYEVAIEYANADVFETDIFIKTDANPWAVIWDGLSVEPTGKDARRVMKETVLSRKDFMKLYPKATLGDVGANPANSITLPLAVGNNRTLGYSDWITEDTVRIATVWTMHERTRTLALLTNGETVDITGVDPYEYSMPDGAGGAHTVVIRANGEPIIRDSQVKYARGVVTNGVEILGEPYELPCDRVPMVRVPGWMLMVGSRMERYGMISFAKDALSFYNYVKSDRIERIVFRNRAQYEAQEDALSPEQEAGYRNSHRLRGGVLKFRGPKPEQVLPPVVDQAAIIETQAAQQSIYDIFGLKPGLVGLEGSTPHSGIALEQQQNIADNGGMIYDEMVTAAKKEVYRIVNQIIPKVYDGPRVAKIIGEDGKAKDAILNDPENPESEDITLGRYAVDVSTGPSADTQRAQAIAFYETMFNSNPELMGLVAPELIELLNIPGTDKLTKALRERSGVLDKDDPEAVAAAQAQAEEAAKVKEMEFADKQADIDKKLADAEAKIAQAEAARATAESEKSQAYERAAKVSEESRLNDSKIDLMAQQIQLIFAQIQKTMVETDKLEKTPIKDPNKPASGGTD